MKAKKTLSHTALVEEITTAVQQRFHPTMQAIKKAIEKVIDKGCFVDIVRLLFCFYFVFFQSTFPAQTGKKMSMFIFPEGVFFFLFLKMRMQN